MNNTDKKYQSSYWYRLLRRFIKEKGEKIRVGVEKRLKYGDSYTLESCNSSMYELTHFFDHLLSWGCSNEGYEFWYATQLEWCFILTNYLISHHREEDAHDSLEAYIAVFGYGDDYKYPSIKEKHGENIKKLKQDYEKEFKYIFCL